jgi:hypothetical protein
MTRELEPDNAGARNHCVVANVPKAFFEASPGSGGNRQLLYDRR